MRKIEDKLEIDLERIEALKVESELKKRVELREVIYQMVFVGLDGPDLTLDQLERIYAICQEEQE